MGKIILTTPEELKEMILETLDEYFKKKPIMASKKAELPDTITLDQALVVLKENGYPTSKAQIYRLTSTNKIPYQKFNNKLVFSRKQLLSWADSRSIKLGPYAK